MSYERKDILSLEAQALREALDARSTHGPDSLEFKEKQEALEALRAKHRSGVGI